MRLVLLLASAAVVIGTAAPAYADPDAKDQAFLNALMQAGLTYMNADRAITAGKQVCSLADGGMTGEEIVKNLQDRQSRVPRARVPRNSRQSRPRSTAPKS